jgi:cell division transport system permease protein
VLHVYLADDATNDQVDALRVRLESDPDISRVTYVSKEEALQRAQHRPGLPELASAADGNPFPASFDVQVRSVDRVAAVDAMVRNDAAVDPTVPTSYDPTAYRRFQQVMLGAAIGMVAFLCLLAFIAVTVTANSIRSAILARRDEIGIMQLVGAPRWMVRGPFVIEGALTGAVAGTAAGGLALLLTILAIQAGASTFAQIAPGLTLQAASVIAALLFVAGPLLGSLSSVASVRRHLEA